ncbi:MAG: O-antigen ligase family protein [Thermodesulfobacteriota bacterium]
MAAKTFRLIESGNKSEVLGRVIEAGVMGLVVAAPLALGSSGAIASSVMQVVSFLVFGIWLFKISIEGNAKTQPAPLFIFFAAFLALVLLQMLPLPIGAVSFISPNTAATLKTFLPEGEAAAWRTLSLYPYATKAEFFKFLSYALLFVAVANHYKSRKQIERLSAVIIALGVFITVFAVAQKLTWNGKFYWFYDLGVNIESNMTYVWGPYVNHNNFAAYMEMAVPLALGMLIYRLSNVKSLPGLPLARRLARLMDSGDMWPMAMFAFSALLMSAALFMSLSRGGIIGFSISILFFIIMGFTRRSLKKWTALIGAAAVIAALLLAIFSWDGIERRFSEIGGEGRTPRFEIWKDSANMVGDFPLTGTGLGTFKSVYPMYQSHSPAFFFAHAENDYVEFLTDTGAAGLFVIMSAIIFYFVRVIRRWRSRNNTFVKCMGLAGLTSCVAILVHSMSDFNMRIPANALLITIISALTYAIVYAIGRGGGANERG